jgi:lipoate-protein ligase A
VIARWRLIVGACDDGASNMAIDEAVLEAYEADPQSPPTLRLYGWSPAALSLGRSQKAAGAHDPGALARSGADLVRRPTGGAAVFHELERTYAVVGGLTAPPFSGSVVDTYRRVAAAVASGLRRLGISAVASRGAERIGSELTGACFARTGAWEIEARGRKLVGAAQARRRSAFLQHGSIPRRLDARRLAEMIGAPVDAGRFTDLTEAAGRDIGDDELDRALILGFEEAFEAELVAGALTEREALRAAELRCWKYDSMAWTFDGAIGAREARWGPVASRRG